MSQINNIKNMYENEGISFAEALHFEYSVFLMNKSINTTSQICLAFEKLTSMSW